MTILQGRESYRSEHNENETVNSELGSPVKIVREQDMRGSTGTRTGNDDDNADDDVPRDENAMAAFIRPGLKDEICKQVLRQKLAKLRHLILREAVSPQYLDSLFPSLLKYFNPQTVVYNGGIANITEWKISCYLEVMEGGVPTTEPNLDLLRLFSPLLDVCNDLFLHWFRQKSACNNKFLTGKKEISCTRLMTFITRYTPAPGEQALLKHVDGAGKVDGSVVVALPIDRWSAPESINSFIGHGGGLTFWDGKNTETGQQNEIHYDTRSGDLAIIDRAVWHQADPITKGTRWALVIFYKVH